MSFNVCQDANSVQVMAPNDKNPIWVATKPSSKVYEKKLKSFILSLESPYSKLKFPSSGQTLALTQPVLVLQLYIKAGSAFSLEVTICDSFGSRRRILFSSAVKEINVQTVHARVPGSEFYRGSWSNFCIDLQKWTAFCFSCSFSSIESVIFTGICQVRKIFTIKQALTENDLYENIGKDLDFPANVLYINQIVTPQSVLSPDVLENQNKTKKTIRRPPITTAPAELLKRLNFGSTFQKPGKTTSEFYNKGSLSPRPLPPLVQDLQKRKFSLERSHEKIREAVSEVQRFTDVHNPNSVETMSESIEEEIEIESCQIEDSAGHHYFPQVKQQELMMKPCFFATAYLEITKHRPFTPPFEEVGEAKEPAGLVREVREAVREEGLMFDPILNCYYDENTEEYFKDNF